MKKIWTLALATFVSFGFAQQSFAGMKFEKEGVKLSISVEEQFVTGSIIETRDGEDTQSPDWKSLNTFVRLRMEKGDLEGYIQANGANMQAQAAGSSIDVYYIKWHLSEAISVLWGKDDPLTFFPTDMSPNTGNSVGIALGYYDEPEQVRFNYKAGSVSFSLAGLKTYEDAHGSRLTIDSNTDSEEYSAPPIEARVDAKLGNAFLSAWVGLFDYKIDTGEKEYNVPTRDIGIGVRFFAGPFSVHFSYVQDINAYQYAIPVPGRGTVSKDTSVVAPIVKDSSVKDSVRTDASLGLYYMIGNSGKIGAGYGITNIKRDNATSGEDEDGGYGWFIGGEYYPTDYIIVRPFYNVRNADKITIADSESDEKTKDSKAGIEWVLSW